MKGVPVLELQGAVNMKPDVDPLQNEALVEMWLDVKIKPLLSSITRELLTCLGTKNFSCATYQTVYVQVRPSPSKSVRAGRRPSSQFDSFTVSFVVTESGSSVTISLRWSHSDRSGSTASSCSRSCPETKSKVLQYRLICL